MTQRSLQLTLAALLFAAVSSPGYGAQQDEGDVWSRVKLSGFTAVEMRYFPDASAFEGQMDGGQSSFVAEPEVSWKSADRLSQVSFVPFVRLDGRDGERTHVDIREAYYQRVEGDWEWLVGVNQVFWGVTESRHLVNVINQIDGVEDIDEEDFLGQPMVQISNQQDYGQFSLFVLPGFRERTFPGVDGRLRAPLLTDEDAATFESGAEQWHTDVALRYAHYIGDVDIGVHGFLGTNREPELRLSEDGERFVPHYVQMTQFGVDVQYTAEAWLWKLEAAHRGGIDNPFLAAVGGVEYTFFEVMDSDADLGLIAEYLHDNRTGNNFPTLFDREVFLGARLALNDTQDTSLLVGAYIDTHEGASAARVEFETRLGERFKLEVEAQWFGNQQDHIPDVFFSQDNFINLRLARYF